MLRAVAQRVGSGFPDLAVADGGTGASTAQGAQANLGGWYMLARSATPVSGAADTNENTLATITIPANSLGPNGAIRMQFGVSTTNNANAKTLRARYSTISGTEYLTFAAASRLHTTLSQWIINRAATNSQVSYTSASLASSTALVTSAVDTTASTTLLITVQKATAGDTITLEWYAVEVSYGA